MPRPFGGLPCTRRDTPDIAKSSSGDAEPVQSGRNRGGWAKDKKKNKEKKGAAAASGPNAEGRVVVYIAGAVSYSEMRVAYEVSQETGWDILIGTCRPARSLAASSFLARRPPPAALWVRGARLGR